MLTLNLARACLCWSFVKSSSILVVWILFPLLLCWSCLELLLYGHLLLDYHFIWRFQRWPSFVRNACPDDSMSMTACRIPTTNWREQRHYDSRTPRYCYAQENGQSLLSWLLTCIFVFLLGLLHLCWDHFHFVLHVMLAINIMMMRSFKTKVWCLTTRLPGTEQPDFREFECEDPLQHFLVDQHQKVWSCNNWLSWR